MVVELSPGDAHDGDPGGGEGPVALAIVLEVAPGAVSGVTVELDHEVRGAP